MLTDRDKLRHRGVWIFDLDHTLYPPRPGLGGQLTDRFGRFVWDTLEIDAITARLAKHNPSAATSTRLKRFIARHGVGFQKLFADGHSIDYAALRKQPRLADALARLPGRKIVFTNASARHAEAVLDRLGLDKAFDAVFDAAAAGYLPKPEPRTYTTLLQRHAIDPTDAVMVEDIPRNLEPAAALGMTTVWARPRHLPRVSIDAAHVHHVTDDLTGWLEGVAGARSIALVPARRAAVDSLAARRHVRA